MTSPVLVTGACGFVGSEVVRRLVQEGQPVVATDLDLAANRRSAGQLFGDVEVRWADLTVVSEVEALLAAVSPAVIIHLAAVIPPRCYARRSLAQAVNVEATASLVGAAEALVSPPRFVLASSVAVYGARNPHRTPDLLSPETEVSPSDLYGSSKVQAEQIVRASRLEWLILRLGGVLSTGMATSIDLDVVYLQAAVPVDNRIHVVDVRDVAQAFANATTTNVVREVLLIGGDDSHRLLWGDLAVAIPAALGLSGGVPPGRNGDPTSDTAWFATDWMDTTRAQQVLSFQRHSLPDMLAEVRAKSGWRRHALGVVAPLTREFLRRRSPYYQRPGTYADPWVVLGEKWGASEPEDLRT